MAIDKHVGARLQKLRELRGLSVKAAASIICISPEQYLQYENGETRISADKLFEYARYYDVSLVSFFSGFRVA